MSLRELSSRTPPSRRPSFGWPTDAAGAFGAALVLAGSADLGPASPARGRWPLTASFVRLARGVAPRARAPAAGRVFERAGAAAAGRVFERAGASAAERACASGAAAAGAPGKESARIVNSRESGRGTPV